MLSLQPFLNLIFVEARTRAVTNTFRIAISSVCDVEMLPPFSFSAGPSSLSFTSGHCKDSEPIPCSGILETELYDWLQVPFVIDWQYGWVKFPDCNRSSCSGSSRVAFKAIDKSILWLHTGTKGPWGSERSLKWNCCITSFDVHTCCQSACGLVWNWWWNVCCVLCTFKMHKNTPIKEHTLILCMLDSVWHKTGLQLFVMSQTAYPSPFQVSGRHHLAVTSTDSILVLIDCSSSDLY